MLREPAGKDMSALKSDSPYSIMFGPDKCFRDSNKVGMFLCRYRCNNRSCLFVPALVLYCLYCVSYIRIYGLLVKVAVPYCACYIFVTSFSFSCGRYELSEAFLFSKIFTALLTRLCLRQRDVYFEYKYMMLVVRFLFCSEMCVFNVFSCKARGKMLVLFRNCGSARTV